MYKKDNNNVLFGMPKEKVLKQLNAQQGHAVDPEFKSGPINTKGETLEPVIRGAKKISRDPELRKTIKEILVK